MTSRLSAIALNTFREAVRDRVLYNLILFVLLLVASAPLFGQISIGLERLILVNVGLSSISLFGVVIAILVGGFSAASDGRKCDRHHSSPAIFVGK